MAPRQTGTFTIYKNSDHELKVAYKTNKTKIIRLKKKMDEVQKYVVECMY
jgi:hypothetical protein